MEVNKQCKGSIHYRYWILILVLLIIAIATDRWTGQDGFTDYLTNAATLTSLLLGLAAIIYSFLSNNSISSSLGSINSVTNELDDVKKEISGYISLAKNIEVASKVNVESLEDVSTEMRQGLQEFACLLAAMGEKNNAMHGMISMLPGRLDDLDSKFSEVATMAKQKPAASEPSKSKRFLQESTVDRYFSRSSPVEILYAYCCVRIWYSSKIIDVHEICKAIGLPSDISIETEAFIRCMDAFGLIEIQDANPKKEGQYIISRINGYFLENCESLARSAICKLYENDSDSDDDLKLWLSTFDEVDGFYAAIKDRAEQISK
ncbi:hypothetical protein QYS36_14030 [Pseudomonas sp. G34]|uniref:hypothetical protein n=1 Tax=Pseudomonas sp. G34 TaxID=3059083 RepID=UPI0028091BFF|nr:hypothetical protein [Pseudomonas sp. G34]MDQ7986056.1 hypothetical protein [Pseudomonas sp. G34]